jgi:hypothetical protein
VAPFDQTLPVVADEVNCTEPPAQKVVEPLFDILGVGGSGFTVTLVVNDVAEQLFAFVEVTE